MKKRKSVILGFVLTIAISLSACDQKTEIKESVESVSEITESVEETENNVADVTESEPAAEETAKVAENVTLDMDLSFLGEIVKDLFVITNDQSKLKTRQEVIDYFHEKGCTFYYPHTVDGVITYDKIVTYDELITYGYDPIVKPDDVLKYSKTGGNSRVGFYFVDWKNDFTDSAIEEMSLKGIHYTIEDCSAETVTAAKEYFDNVLTSGIFDNCEYEIIYYRDDEDATTWRGIDLLIKGKPVNPELDGMFFCCLSISLTEEQILIGLSLM